MNIKHLFVICHLMFAIMLCGCAKVVTPVFPPGQHMVVDINFRDNIDPTQNRYYIILNNDAAPRIPFMPIQFVEPGEMTDQPEVDLYTDYYPTWKEYLVLEGNTIYLIKPPFTSEAVPTREAVAAWSGAYPKKISFVLDMVNLTPPQARLNFDFVTVDKTTKLVKDNLSNLNSTPSPYYVLPVKDSIVSGSDEAISEIRGGLDILDWRVLIN